MTENDRRDNVGNAAGRIFHHLDEVQPYYSTIPNAISFCCSHPLNDTFRLRLLLIGNELAVIAHPQNDIGVCGKIPNLEKFMEARDIIGSSAFATEKPENTGFDSLLEYLWYMWTREIPILRDALTGICMDDSRIAATAQNARETMMRNQDADRNRWLKRLMKAMDDE